MRAVIDAHPAGGKRDVRGGDESCELIQRAEKLQVAPGRRQDFGMPPRRCDAHHALNAKPSILGNVHEVGEHHGLSAHRVPNEADPGLVDHPSEIGAS